LVKPVPQTPLYSRIGESNHGTRKEVAVVITLSPEQQSAVADLMRDGAYDNEEDVITSALRALREEHTSRRLDELTEEGLRSWRERGSLPGGEALWMRLEKAIQKGLAEGRKPADHIVHGV